MQHRSQYEVSISHLGPAVLLWLWDAMRNFSEHDLRPCPISHVAGSEGVVLVATF